MTETAAGDELETSLTSADSSRLLLNIADMSQVLYGVWHSTVTAEEISDDGRAAPLTD